MAYITQDDLLQRMTLLQLAQLTDDSGAKPPSVDATVVGGILDEASAKVDGYCRTKYATPLQQSGEVSAIARDIGAYLAYSRRPGQIPEQARKRYEDAMALLKDISTGKATLDQPSGAPAQGINAGPVIAQDDLRFKECNIKGYV